MAAKIMVVEDDGIIRVHLQNVLKKNGYQVCGMASSGPQAVALAMETRPDLILMDIVLDGPMDGIEAAAEIHTQADIPIIYLTAYADAHIIERARITDAFGYLLKPFEERSLLATLQMALKKFELENQLRLSETRFRNYFELSLVGTAITGLDGRLINGNQRFTEIMGYTIDEIRQVKWQDITHPDDLAISEYWAKRMLRENLDQYSLEKRYIRKDGKTIYTRIQVRSLRGADGEIGSFLSHIEDITESKLAEEALRQSEATLRAIFDSSRESFILLDRQRIIQAFNRAASEHFETMTGKKLQKGLGIEIFVPKANQQIFAQNILSALQGRYIEVQREFRVPHASPRWFRLGYNPVKDEEGKIVGTCLTAMEITESKLHAREQRAIATIASALREATLAKDMYRIILDNAADLMEAAGTLLVIQAACPGEDQCVEAVGEWQSLSGGTPPSEEIHQAVLGSRQPYINNDLPIPLPSPLAALSGGGVRSVICVPLVTRDLALGTLWVGRSVPTSTAEIRVLTAVADLAASAIQREILYEQTQRRLQQVQTLRQVDAAISANQDLDQILSLLTQHAAAQLQVPAIIVLRYDPAANTLQPQALYGKVTSNPPPPVHMQLDLAAEALFKQAALQLTRQTSQVTTGRRTAWMAAHGFHDYLAVPLIAKDAPKGVLEVFLDRPQPLDPDWWNLLEAIAIQAAIAFDNFEMVDNLQRSNQELIQAYEATLAGWARALNLRDQPTETHSQNVINLTLRLARQVGIPEEQLPHIRRGALLHDIGKLGVPDRILRKHGPLSEDEAVIMRQHPQYAYDMLYPIEFLRPALNIPYAHHERWDGSGYPRGLRGEEIPLEARIFSIVDVWDSLCSDRPYRKAWSRKRAYDHIRAQAGTQFDPQLVEAFLAMEPSFPCLREE